MADLTDEQLAEIERDWEHVVATGGAVKLAECDTCAAAYDAFPVLLRALRDARAENASAWAAVGRTLAENEGLKAREDAWRVEHHDLRGQVDALTAEVDAATAERDALRAENVVLRQRIEDACVAWGDQPIPLHAFVGHVRTVLAAPTGQEVE